MGSKERTRVVVIGAGLAGLGAAWRLFRVGCDVTVVERRTRVGGRVAGRTEDGYSIDPRPQVVHPHPGLLDFINTLGLSDRLLPLRPVRFSQVNAGKARSIDTSSLVGISRVAGVRWRDVVKLPRFVRLMERYAPMLDPDRPELAADLDFRSVADFARLYFGDSLFRHWIAPTATAAASGDEFQLSRVVFLLAWTAAQRGTPGIARQGLHELARHAGEQLSVRTQVEALELEPLAGAGHRIHCRSSRGDETLEADAVVVASGADDAARIASVALAPAERDFFAQVDYAHSISFSVALDRPITGVPLEVRVPHGEGSGIEVHLVEPGGAHGRAPTGCGLVTASSTEDFAVGHLAADDRVVEKALCGDLERWYPRFSQLVRFTAIGRWEKALPRFEVGAYRALARFARVQVDRRQQGRRLYFAGDYLMGPSIEAAHVSGERAAEALLQDFR